MQNVVIIGAGLAGLTAAHYLKQRGCRVKVFEARPRIGGRVHTVNIKNLDGNYSTAELGGQSINDGGECVNIKLIISELGLKLNEYKTHSRMEFYHNGKYYTSTDFKKELAIDEEKLTAKFEDFKSMNSIQQVLDNLFDDHSILKRLITYRMHAYEGSHTSQLSVYHNLETLKSVLFHTLYYSDRHWMPSTIVGGNVLLPQRLADSQDISLNKVLSQVHNDADKIVLKFEDGSIHRCDKLIMATPASVYKNIEFNGLMDFKQLDIFKRIQYGSNAKILSPIRLQTPKLDIIVTTNMCAWFNEHQDIATYYIINDSNESYLNNVYKAEQSIYSNRYLRSEFSRAQPVIATDEQFSSYYTPVMKSWVNDRHALGSYSNYSLKLNCQLDEKVLYKDVAMKKVFAPVDDKIFFIGEHTTILDEIGTMEAAVESGKRVAKIF